jgi:catechol-2,3-dioxygenase
MNIEHTVPSRNRQLARARRAAGRSLEQLLENRSDAPWERASGALRLGHVHLKVRCLDRSVPFYVTLLGLHLTEQVGRFAFLALGEEHHSVALEEMGDWVVSPPPRSLMVGHVAFEVQEAEAFHGMEKRLRHQKVPFISSNNGTNWALDFKDPDGHRLQIVLDRRHSPEGTPLWRGLWYGPLETGRK